MQIMQTGDDFGAQGGDPRRMTGGVHIDLSTCVNFYGPPPAVLQLFRDGIEPADLQIHPYAAAERMEAAYARHLGVPASELVAGRGTTEFIWALSRQVRRETVAVPLPAYTDYLKAFPGRGFPGAQIPAIEHIDAALAASSLVIISNPHNPSGVALAPDELVAAAARHPATTFVVDESYVDFLLDPRAATVVGTDVENIVVLRSPSKFWGIAATRVGVAWCRDRDRLDALLGRRETWPISGLDVAVAEAAMGSADWAERSRLDLAEDAAWLAGELRRLPGELVERDVGIHYRCLITEDAEPLAAAFAAHGVGVRALGHAHGVRPGALRILAPLRHQRAAVAAAVAAMSGHVLSAAA
ncbi:MAG TPA: aminotransferase class I/II-fold pyridoxal phosphate-dependent enzyme [Solirubrobacteraceae bacterium]|nr:aminotransferase class I/II-fold pyridoxal phosphate-dependent enzyme [Solirubrobacteraceae bacterium]